MFTQKHTSAIDLELGIDSGTPRKIPDSMETDQAISYNQNHLAVERTDFAKIRTDLALTNTWLAVNRTHLSYLRTIVSLIGSGATLYKALPLFGINQTFTGLLTAFLLLTALYFIYKDATTYPKMKRRLRAIEKRASELARKAEDQVYSLDNESPEKDNEEILP